MAMFPVMVAVVIVFFSYQCPLGTRLYITSAQCKWTLLHADAEHLIISNAFMHSLSHFAHCPKQVCMQ